MSDRKQEWRCHECSTTGFVPWGSGTMSDDIVAAILAAHHDTTPNCSGEPEVVWRFFEHKGVIDERV